MINVGKYSSPMEHIWDMDTHIDHETPQKNSCPDISADESG